MVSQWSCSANRRLEAKSIIFSPAVSTNQYERERNKLPLAFLCRVLTLSLIILPIPKKIAVDQRQNKTCLVVLSVVASKWIDGGKFGRSIALVEYVEWVLLELLPLDVRLAVRAQCRLLISGTEGF